MLDLKFTAVLSSDGKTITLKDTTGAYNVSTNPGGYGTENNFTFPPEWLIVGWKYWAATSITTALKNDSNANLATTGQALTPATVGQTGTVFKDGVHQFIPYVLNRWNPDAANLTTVTLVEGSKVVTRTNTGGQGTNNQDLIDFLAGTDRPDDVYVSFDDGNDPRVYKIDLDEPVTLTQFSLTEAYTGINASGITWYLGFAGDVKVLVNIGASTCIASKVGKVSVVETCKPAQEAEIMRLLRWLYGANIQFQQLDYTGAHNAIVAINQICKQENCGCC